MLSYVLRDLARNRRRTLACLVGVTLGVGMSSSVLFFIDASGATMTRRAIAPLALDMQWVLTSPLGGGLRLEERVAGPSQLHVGQKAKIVLTVSNDAAEPAHEVVVNDEPPRPLEYVAGTTIVGGKELRDTRGRIPLAQGLARAGLNIGTVPPRKAVKLSYVARASRIVAAVDSLNFNGRVSSREDFVPAPANPPPQLSLARLTDRIAKVSGVAAANGLSFVDLPPGSLRAPRASVTNAVRVFAFDQRYPEDYPSIRIVAGSFEPGSALLSAEASRALETTPGNAVRLRLPGRPRPLSLPVAGIADLGRAKPLFYSRQSDKFEDFLYIPNAIVVTPATFTHAIIPAFRAARAKRGAVIKSVPAQEVDVLVDRSRLRSDPASAFAQTRTIARAIQRMARDQGYLIDNISNALAVARDDATVGKRMFLFLGLPGLLLAAFLTAYAGSVLAATQRREHATLRVRGAHRGHFRRMLVYRTLAFATLGSLLGCSLGFLSALLFLTPTLLFEAPRRDLIASAIVATVGGMLTTAVALYIPGRRSLGREVSQERAELANVGPPVWRRLRLDFVLLGMAAIAEVIAYRAGAFDPPTASVSLGQSVTLPARLLLAPLIAWFAGALLLVRTFVGIASRLRMPPPARFGPLIRGTLTRSVVRRSWTLGTGVGSVAFVLAFGTCLSLFAATYNAAKAADARFVVGSDLRITPSALSSRPHRPEFASRLRVSGVSAVAPVVFKLENAVLIGPDNQDRADLAALAPGSFSRVAALSDTFFLNRSAAEAMAALQAHPRGLLVEAEIAESLGISVGERVQVLLARGTTRQTLSSFHVIDVFVNFPGFPQQISLVTNLHYYEAATGSSRVNFFLARITNPGPAGLARAVAALRSGPGRQDPMNIDTTATALDKDQSSLTALNVNGLVNLNSLYTLMMSAAGIAIFVFGLLLQRHREFVTLRAQGLQTWELQVLVLAEAALVAVSGLAAGLLVGTGMALLLVHILRPLFILDPKVAFFTAQIGTLTALVMLATLASALIATGILRRLKPTEILRDA